MYSSNEKSQFKAKPTLPPPWHGARLSGWWKRCSVLQLRKCSCETVNVAAIVQLYFKMSGLKGKNIGASFLPAMEQPKLRLGKLFLMPLVFIRVTTEYPPRVSPTLIFYLDLPVLSLPYHGPYPFIATPNLTVWTEITSEAVPWYFYGHWYSLSWVNFLR